MISVNFWQLSIANWFAWSMHSWKSYFDISDWFCCNFITSSLIFLSITNNCSLHLAYSDNGSYSSSSSLIRAVTVLFMEESSRFKSLRSINGSFCGVTESTCSARLCKTSQASCVMSREVEGPPVVKWLLYYTVFALQSVTRSFKIMISC